MKTEIYLLNHHDLCDYIEGIGAQRLPSLLEEIPEHYREAYGQQKAGAIPALASGLLLWKVLGITSDEMLCRGEWGKLTANGDVHFCLSHAKGMTLLAVSAAPLGADLEEIPPAYEEKMAKNRASIAGKWFPQEMASCYRAAAPADQPYLFSRYWTCLEAVLKAEGCGFHVKREGIPSLFEKWKVQNVEMDGYMAAVAADAVSEIRVREIQPWKM